MTLAEFKALHEGLTGDWGNPSIEWLNRMALHDDARQRLGIVTITQWERWIRQTYLKGENDPEPTPTPEGK